MEDKLEKMKKKSDLSDIILEKEGSSNEKIKKMLLIVASLVLLFLVILIAMKLFNNPNVSPSENLAELNQNIQNTETKVEEKASEALGAATTAVDEGKNALFKEEPIIDDASETDQKFEEMVRKLKQQDALESKASQTQDLTDPNATTAKLSGDENITLDNTKEANVIDKIKDVATMTTEPKAEVAPVEKVVTQTQKPVGDIFSQTNEKSTPKVQRAPSASSGVSSSGYYIQVGATAQAFPDQKFLSKIKNSGYDYVIQKSNVNGQVIKKVLVGPFSSREQARSELGGIQTKINPGAYIYKVN